MNYGSTTEVARVITLQLTRVLNTLYNQGLLIQKVHIMQDKRFFIRDCNDVIIDNPKGYRTYKGAHRQITMRGSKINDAIWNTFYMRSNKADMLIYTIKIEG